MKADLTAESRVLDSYYNEAKLDGECTSELRLDWKLVQASSKVPSQMAYLKLPEG